MLGHQNILERQMAQLDKRRIHSPETLKYGEITGEVRGFWIFDFRVWIADERPAV